MDSRYLRGKVDGVDGVDGWSTFTVVAQTGPVRRSDCPKSPLHGPSEAYGHTYYGILADQSLSPC